MSEYKKSCLDEINFAKAEQMHAAALQISKTCFDFKKLCVSFLGVTMAFLINFTPNKVDHSYFIVGLILIVGFWLSDATAYFYQKSLRSKIDIQFQQISIRNQVEDIFISTKATVHNALFNASMFLYYMLGILFLNFWLAFSLGWIE